MLANRVRREQIRMGDGGRNRLAVVLAADLVQGVRVGEEYVIDKM